MFAKAQQKMGAFTTFEVFELPPELLGQLSTQGKPQAHAGGGVGCFAVRFAKGLKELFPEVFGNSRSLVPDVEHDVFSVLRCLNVQDDALWSSTVFTGVFT